MAEKTEKRKEEEKKRKKKKIEKDAGHGYNVVPAEEPVKGPTGKDVYKV
jgi:hypothetical protein